MGLIERILGLLFGNGGNVVAQTAEVFRENAEAGAERAASSQAEALKQFAAEFASPSAGIFDRIIDALNRLPRPALALGTVGLFVAAMVDPVWFAARMQGIALVPEPLWWLLGVIVSFYFGARHQLKSQEFQRSIAATMVRTPQVTAHIEALEDLRETRPDAIRPNEAPRIEPVSGDGANPALEAWRNGHRPNNR